jgi:hypothetical protein
MLISLRIACTAASNSLCRVHRGAGSVSGGDGGHRSVRPSGIGYAGLMKISLVVKIAKVVTLIDVGVELIRVQCVIVRVETRVRNTYTTVPPTRIPIASDGNLVDCPNRSGSNDCVPYSAQKIRATDFERACPN